MEFVEGSSISITNIQFSALIVDDEPLIRKIHSEILKSVGFKLQVAQNGKEVVDLYRAGAKFHIVLMDMQMPMMNGIEATKLLRAMGVKRKIVGVSSFYSESEKQAFILAGLDVCYDKPLTVEKIIPLLEQLKVEMNI